MPPRKKAEAEFPPISCGACEFMHPMDDEDVREQQGACFGVPPVVIADHGSARPLVEWSDFPCHLFRPRAHA